MAFVTKRPSGYYICWIDQDKKRKFITCNTKIKGIALKELTKFITKENPNYHKRNDLLSFQNEIYEYSINNHKPKTQYIYKFTIKKFLDIIGNKRLSDYNLIDIENYKTERIKTIKAASLNIELRCLKTIFTHSYIRGYCMNNISKHIKQIPNYQKQRINIPLDQYNQIINTCKSETIKKIITTAYYTGLRESELLNLKWENIDYKNRLIIINAEDIQTKNKKSRIIPISSKLDFLLQPDKISSLYIFIKNEKQINLTYLSKYFKKLCRVLEMPETYNFHCLRHSFITNLINSGVEITTVKELAGHSSITTTMIYTHINLNQKINAINKL